MAIIDTDLLDYETCSKAIDMLEKLSRDQLYPVYAAEQRRIAATRRFQREERLRRDEAAAEELFKTLIPGDIVRIVGTRNRNYPYREITSINDHKFYHGRSISGWQMKKNRDGTFSRGSEHTTHMANKVREVVHRATLELEVA